MYGEFKMKKSVNISIREETTFCDVCTEEIVGSTLSLRSCKICNKDLCGSHVVLISDMLVLCEGCVGTRPDIEQEAKEIQLKKSALDYYIYVEKINIEAAKQSLYNKINKLNTK